MKSYIHDFWGLGCGHLCGAIILCTTDTLLRGQVQPLISTPWWGRGAGQEGDGRNIKAFYHVPVPGPLALVVAVACTMGCLKAPQVVLACPQI